MRNWLRLSRWIDRLTRKIGQLTYLLTIAMVSIGVWNVIGRFLGRGIGQNLSSNASIEIQWYLFAIVFLCGGAYTLQQGGHVRVDVFYSRLNRKRKALVDLAGSLLFAIPFSVLAIAFSWSSIAKSWAILEQSPDPDGLPRYPIKSFILVGFVLIILQAISEAIKNVAILRGLDPGRAQPGESTTRGGTTRGGEP